MNERNIQLVNRLAAYSFASLAFVAIRDDAQASVVYSDLEPDSLIMGNDTMYLDIDGDGADDMWFWIESKTGSIESSGGVLVPYQYRFAYAQGLGVNAIMGKQATFSGYIINSAYRFESGELIADTVPKFTAKARLAGFLSVDGSVIYEGGPWSGADNAFLGLRFKISGATHFAWLRLSVATDGSSIQITELAWDNQVDAAIVAGSTVAIPANPGSPDFIVYSDCGAIVIQSPVFLEDASCKIFDVQGRQVYDAHFSGTNHTIAMQSFAGGIYIIAIVNRGTVLTKKIALGK